MTDSPGLAVRKEVLGPEYVERAYAQATDFTRELQDFLVEHCWGGVWTRPGLPLSTRSIVTLSVLAVGRSWGEFRTHVRGALRNGVSADELREVFLHIGVYAGVPVAVEAFRVAAEVVGDWQES
jgi:4-carboxymuconolactone decarboxylase